MNNHPKYLNLVIIFTFYFTFFVESSLNAFNPSSLTMKKELSSISTCAFIQKKFLALECPPLENEDIDESIVPCFLGIYKENDAPFRSFCKILHPKMSGLCLE